MQWIGNGLVRETRDADVGKLGQEFVFAVGVIALHKLDKVDFQPCPRALTTAPNAADVLPLPSPVNN